MVATLALKDKALVLNRKLRRVLARFGRQESGIAAVEFALILPIMMTMYFGLVEFSQALGHDRKSVVVTRSLVDMVTQSVIVDNADMTSIFAAATAVMAPYPQDRIAMRVTSYRIDGAGNAFVDWSDVRNINAPVAYVAKPHCEAANPSVPSQIRAVRTSLVQAEVLLNHRPTIGYTLVGNIEMKESQFMKPRIAATVARAGANTAPCPGFVP